MSLRELFYIPQPSSYTFYGIAEYARTHPDYFIVLLIILIIGILALSLVFRIYWTKKKNTRARKHEKNTLLDAEDLLSEYLGEAISFDEALHALNRLIHKENRPLESITSVFRSYFQMLSGDSKTAMINLFIASDLSKLTLKRIKYPDEHVILFIELSAASKFTEAKQELKKLLKHPLLEVRFEALCALVDLFKFNALSYMLDVKYQPSEWEEMILMQKLLRAPSPKDFDLDSFLKSDNQQLVRFAVRAAQQFNRFEVSDTFKELIDSPSNSTRRRVYEAAGSLLMNELQHDIIRAFEKEELVNQRIILKTLSKLGDDEAYPFLQEVFTSRTPELSLLAGIAIYHISNESEVLDNIVGDDEELQRMLEHIKDPLIS